MLSFYYLAYKNRSWFNLLVEVLCKFHDTCSVTVFEIIFPYWIKRTRSEEKMFVILKEINILETTATKFCKYIAITSPDDMISTASSRLRYLRTWIHWKNIIKSLKNLSAFSIPVRFNKVTYSWYGLVSYSGFFVVVNFYFSLHFYVLNLCVLIMSNILFWGIHGLWNDYIWLINTCIA